MKYEQITPPIGSAVPLATAKAHLVVEHAADDELISLYIGQAASWAASYTGRHIGAQSWAVYADDWCGALSLPFSPVQSVVVTYIDIDGATQTLPADQYFLDDKQYPATISPRPTVTWPDLGDGPNVVTVTCQTGAAVLDGNISAAIYLLVGSLYEQRSESAPINIHRIPHGVTTFLDLVRLVWVA
jgi:uncharacterized phiE125 gp8 family phage protein